MYFERRVCVSLNWYKCFLSSVATLSFLISSPPHTFRFLGHRDKHRKVAGLIPNGVIENFH